MLNCFVGETLKRWCLGWNMSKKIGGWYVISEGTLTAALSKLLISLAFVLGNLVEFAANKYINNQVRSFWYLHNADAVIKAK